MTTKSEKFGTVYFQGHFGEDMSEKRYCYKIDLDTTAFTKISSIKKESLFFYNRSGVVQIIKSEKLEKFLDYSNKSKHNTILNISKDGKYIAIEQFNDEFIQ